MTSPVKLYVYDLSNGLAKQLSLSLTGKQIDGIWHTSVVVFGKEIFYGQGILTTAPGRSHHGQPMQIVDMGETALDEETFQEYLNEMRQHYTADKYHLLDFNCNSFTNDCIGFLTGQSIPSWIKDLPADFLSTPFGASLRPTIDAMFRRPTGDAPAAPSPVTPQVPQQTPNPQLASALLQAVASRAAANANGSPTTASGSGSGSGSQTPSTTTVAAPVHIATNPTSFHSLLDTHRCVVAFFTSATCAPCKMVEPMFEELAHAKTRGGGRIAFVKVDLGVGMGGAVAREYGVSATPTFEFFLDRKKVHELKGANAPELRTQVDLLLYQAYPPHPHTKLDLREIKKISLDPILFTQVPALDTVKDKLFTFIDAVSSPSVSDQAKQQTKALLNGQVFPWLKKRFSSAPNSSSQAGAATPAISAAFGSSCKMLVTALPSSSLFPLLDVWRLATLEPSLATASLNSLSMLLEQMSSSVGTAPRPTLLTLLRLLSNCLGSPSISRSLLTQEKAAVTSVVVQSILHEDKLVRVAAASVAFNVAAWVQRGRVARIQGGNEPKNGGMREDEEDGEWEVELVSAIVEALEREKESEEVVHRLSATLALLIRLSPAYENSLVPLLEVLQVRSALRAKVEGEGEGGMKLQKKEVKALVLEVADKLCV
ncbi:DUF862-domain-containing protein [Stereum hirsutum FP-91666 SS1]|uniref:DUF862-domain-containing protein n=1 Tax=Stereum hirsutum (strain FP-91666) TaxID=721885 RepID=UPI0004449512|nr:DUF862-domain-containing protein [Stereum hirsutum FP-91666 SS1]EIM85886.1 DUF862-domain-containing protein [Stereum hirsutum FP-91666 SS1]